MLCLLTLYIFVYCFCSVVFFFFKQKTAYEMRISDWSSDVCSSDLAAPTPDTPCRRRVQVDEHQSRPATRRVRAHVRVVGAPVDAPRPRAHAIARCGDRKSVV